ncbi:pLS20_p028 family conjugation system transmembrane protein [Siminovitchia sp. 179-K 8D1 HS]|uniref:pLS20_p028 family conjugation system transmembrane protein n=1 Tax=Siminovitchia sp. 179-K 8D1 HS TaxID=3142385 RepID=UPI0039A06999
MSEEQLIDLYKKLDYLLHLSDGWLWQDLFRIIGGGLVFLLSWLNNFIEGIIDKIVTLNNFYSSGPMKEFMDIARPIVWGVFFIALFILGFQFMMNKIEKRNEIILNVILALCFIVVIPDLMINMGKITKIGVEEINPEKQSLATELVKSNVADVRYYAENNFRFSGKKNGDNQLPPLPASKVDSKIGTTDFTHANRLTEDSLPYISFTEKLDVKTEEKKGGIKGWAEKNLDKTIRDEKNGVLANKLVATGNGDQFEVQQLREHQIPLTTLGQESYYRYHVNWFVLIFSLAVTTVALAITVIKIGRSIFDLAFHQIFGMFIAATDLTGGQRTKKVLVEIMNTFAVIFIMTMLLKLFILYSSWANGLKGSIGGVGVLLLLIAGAWALIDAPDIVQRMLGIDAGLRSGYQAMLGAYAGARLAGTGTKAVGKGIEKSLGLAGKATTGLAGGANFARRTVSGIASKTPEEMAGRSRVPVKPMPGIAAKGEIPKQGSEKMKGNGESPKMANEGIRDGISASGNEQLDTASQTKQKSGESFVNSAIPSQPSGHAKDRGISKVQSSKGAIAANKGTEGQMKGPISAGKGTSSNAKRQSVGSSSQVGQSQQNIPSGYAQTASGILVPGSAVDKMETSPSTHSSYRSQITSSTISAQSGPQSSVSPIGGNQDTTYTAGTVEKSSRGREGYAPSTSGQTVPGAAGEPTFGPPQQSKSYGHKEVHHTNTLAGGNRHVQQAKEQIVRAGNSGFSLGQSIRRLGRGSGNAAIQTARAVVHPKQTLQTGIDKTKSATHSRVNNMKQSMNTFVHQIKTPPGHRMNRKGKHNE